MGVVMNDAKTFVPEWAPSSSARNLVTSCQSSIHESINPAFVCGVPVVVWIVICVGSVASIGISTYGTSGDNSIVCSSAKDDGIIIKPRIIIGKNKRRNFPRILNL